MTGKAGKGNPATGLREVGLGVVFGLDNLSHAVAVSSLVFAGSLAAGAALGTAVFMLAAIVGTATLMLRPWYVGPAYSNVQNASLAVLIPLVFVIGSFELGTEEKVANVFALLGLTTLLTGIVMVAMSLFDLGRLVRLMPYSVTAGYLAAAGALLVRSAVLAICDGASCSPEAFSSHMAESALLPSLTVGFAVLLWLSVLVSRNFGLVACIVLGFAGFYLSLPLFGLDVAEARDLGLVPRPYIALDIGALAGLSLADIRFDFLLDHWPTIAAAIVISLFGSMINATAAELALRRDINVRRELARAGGVNMFIGLIGSSIAYISGSTTTSAGLVGARSRIAPLTTCAMLAIAVVYSAEIHAAMPRFIAAGLLMFFGVAILRNWLFSKSRRQSLSDWLLSLAIVAIALTFGMPTAVAVGILTASLIFAVTYARLSVVRNITDLGARRSTVDRGPVQTRFLDENGGKVAVVSLQGFLFFGSVTQLSATIRSLLDRADPVVTVILDFSRVSRIDGAAIMALRKLDLLAGSRNASVVLCDLNTHVEQEIRRSNLLEDAAALRLEETCDTAIEAAEDEILGQLPPPPVQETARSALEQITEDPKIAERLLAIMERETVPRGTTLLRQGEKSGDVFVIDSGSLSVYIRGKDGKQLRVQKQRPGAVVGEIASYSGSGRTADVVADTDTVVYRLREQSIAEVQRTDPGLASSWHRAMAGALAEKLKRTNQLLGDQS